MAFQPCITLHLVKMDENNKFLNNKKCPKRGTLVDTVLDQLTSEGARTPILKSVATFEGEEKS